jgi:hypothetical protein
MKDEEFRRLGIQEKLNQIRKNQITAIWYTYALFVSLVILIGVGFAIS